jgi:drug/metabolite transporter (DMT)-like permease
VSNVVFARFVLGEQVTPRVLLATAVIVAGQVLIVLFSSHKTNDYDARGLMALYDGTFLVRAYTHKHLLTSLLIIIPC